MYKPTREEEEKNLEERIKTNKTRKMFIVILITAKLSEHCSSSDY